MNRKKNANSNPGEERQLFHPESEKVVEIGLERLRPFKNHPFKVKEDEAMAQLIVSIFKDTFLRRICNSDHKISEYRLYGRVYASVY